MEAAGGGPVVGGAEEHQLRLAAGIVGVVHPDVKGERLAQGEVRPGQFLQGEGHRHLIAAIGQGREDHGAADIGDVEGVLPDMEGIGGLGLGGKGGGDDHLEDAGGVAAVALRLGPEVEVDLDAVAFPRVAGDPWEGDSVEIYLDLRPEAQRDGSYASGVFQMVIAPALAPEAKTTYSFHVGENAFHIPDVRGTVVLSALTDGGYQVTVSFPLEELARTHLPLGESLAFDIGVNDADDAGRESQLMLFGTADNWTSTRGFHSIAP